MIHYYVSDLRTNHFAVSHSLMGTVLVQLGDESGEQIRINLTPEQAKHMSNLLLVNIEKAKSQDLFS